MAAASENRVRPLLPAETIERRVTEIAEAIDRDHRDVDELLCVGILKGSVFFLVELLRRLDTPVAVDFFQTASYQGTEPGEVRIRKDLDISVRDRHVLLVEDIVDTGHTVRTILGLLAFRKARSVKLCTLLDKEEARQVDVPIDYRGFRVENRFLVGYGLDLDQRYRNLPYIGVIETGEEYPS